MPTSTATTSRISVPLNKGANSHSPSSNLTNPQSRIRRSRQVRRRGRRTGEFGSDDDIERETLSDETDSDEASLLDDSASETEPESDVDLVSHRRPAAHIDTPSTQSPQPGDVALLTTLNGFDDSNKDKSANVGHQHTTATAFLSSGVDWSEMTSEELPVVEFALLQEGGIASLPESTQKVAQEADSSLLAIEEGGHLEQSDAQAQLSAAAGRGAHSPGQPRGRGAAQVARQAYQSRLQEDPSFVPVVGEFWSHDDRLMQKDLRSLSGWWRGRWQGRGRGRGGFVGGRGMGFRGHGRGGFATGQLHEQPPSASMEENIPPVDRAWTHDGFEEMKAREDRRRRFEQDKTSGFQGRQQDGHHGGFASENGRGSFNRHRAFSPVPSNGSGRARANTTSSNHPARGTNDKIWYARKPECPWTKQHEAFLHFEPSLKPKGGKGPAYRVRLPGGKGGELVRSTAVNETVAPTSTQTHAPESVTDRASNFVVRLPRHKERVHAVDMEQQSGRESFTTMEELSADLPSTSTLPTAVQVPAAVANGQPAAGPSRPPADAVIISTVYPTPPAETGQPLLSQNPDAEIFIAPSQISPSSIQKFELERAHVSQLPPIQTVFPPPTQHSPSFNSPYAFAAPQPPLPPGVALDQRGFAYEVASGRPVYLHPTPPPSQPHHMPLYNPRPMVHHAGMPFAPGHMQHPSGMAAEYMIPHAHTPPMNGFVDGTGAPLFALPRQSSRVEIRAPGEVTEGKGKEREKRPSGLSRGTTVEDVGAESEQGTSQGDQTSAQFTDTNAYFAPASIGGSAPNGFRDDVQVTSLPQAQVMDPSMMGYAQYHQPYYYPDHYGYPMYPEYPQHPQAVGHYEPYVLDPHAPPAAIYY